MDLEFFMGWSQSAKFDTVTGEIDVHEVYE